MQLTDVLMYILPAFIVMMGMFFVLKRFLDRDANIRVTEAKHQKYKETLPLRLQAYERLSIFLERISPPSLLPRVLNHAMSANLLRSQLITTINAEFEHNVSQQIYVSADAWKSVRTAKEETIHLIHLAYDKMNDASTGIELSAKIYEHISRTGNFPSETSLTFLKAEAGKLI